MSYNGMVSTTKKLMDMSKSKYAVSMKIPEEEGSCAQDFRINSPFKKQFRITKSNDTIDRQECYVKYNKPWPRIQNNQSHTDRLYEYKYPGNYCYYYEDNTVDSTANNTGNCCYYYEDNDVDFTKNNTGNCCYFYQSKYNSKTDRNTENDYYKKSEEGNCYYYKQPPFDVANSSRYSQLAKSEIDQANSESLKCITKNHLSPWLKQIENKKICEEIRKIEEDSTAIAKILSQEQTENNNPNYGKNFPINSYKCGQFSFTYLKKFIMDSISSAKNTSTGFDIANFIITAIIINYNNCNYISYIDKSIFRLCLLFLPKTLLQAYVLLKRYLVVSVIQSEENLKDLFFICCLISYKVQADFNIMNFHLVQDKDVSLSKVNYLEALVLNAINYNIFSDEEDINNAITEISLFNCLPDNFK